MRKREPELDVVSVSLHAFVHRHSARTRENRQYPKRGVAATIGSHVIIPCSAASTQLGKQAGAGEPVLTIEHNCKHTHTSEAHNYIVPLNVALCAERWKFGRRVSVEMHSTSHRRAERIAIAPTVVATQSEQAEQHRAHRHHPEIRACVFQHTACSSAHAARQRRLCGQNELLPSVRLARKHTHTHSIGIVCLPRVDVSRAFADVRCVDLVRISID